MIISSLALLVLVVGLSIGLPLITKQNKKGETPAYETTKAIETTTKKDNQVTQTSNTTPSSTPTEVLEHNEIVERFEWEPKGLPLEGKYKQFLPIQNIIMMKTKSSLPCIDKV